MCEATGKWSGWSWRSRATWLGVACLMTLFASPEALAGGAVQTIAQSAASSLGRAPPSSLVVAAPVESDQPAPKGDDLALRLAALLAGRLGAGARVYPRVEPLGTARAVAGRASALVYVQTEIARGDLRATVDTYPPMGNAWDRIRNPLPAPIGHAFATAKIDPEVRTFLTPLVLEQASVDRAHHDEGEVLAAACGDVDDDGGNEIALVSRTRVAIGRLHGGRFVAEHTAAWSVLAPRAPVPMRDPLATAVVRPGAVDVGSTDRGSLALGPDLSPVADLSGMPVWGGQGLVCLLPRPSTGAFEGVPFDCSVAHETRPSMTVPASPFDAFAATVIADPRGGSRTVVVVREPNGRIDLRMGDAPPRTLDGRFGAQLAVGDLDQDGLPEIVTTLDDASDALTVATWASPGEDPQVRLRLPAPSGVRALAVCPPEEQGEPALVAVVGDEVWLVRAAVAPIARPESRTEPGAAAR